MTDKNSRGVDPQPQTNATSKFVSGDFLRDTTADLKQTERSPRISGFLKLIALFRENFAFGKVVQAPVLLFYAERGEFISQHVLKGLPHHVIRVRQLPLPLNLRLLTGLLRELLARFFRHMTGSATSVTGAIRKTLIELQIAYFTAYLRDCRPAVVLTFIDNSVLFHQLSQRFPKIRFITIQNGVRTERIAEGLVRNIQKDGRSKPEIQEFFALGPQSIELYQRNGISIRKPVAAGSLKADVHRSRTRVQTAPNFDLCLISHWKEQFYQESNDDDVMRYNQIRSNAVDRLNDYLRRYMADREASLCIALRNLNPSEISFYENVFQGQAVLLPQDNTAIASYRALEQGRLVIGMYSTLIYEALALGHRALAMNLLDDRQLDPPMAGVWSLEDSGYNVFRDRLDTLLGMADDDYWKQTKPFADWMVTHNTGCPVHERLRSAVEESLAASASAR